MTPRGTDWSLAFLVAILFTTGLLSLISGRTDDAWVFALHGIGGFALGAVTTVKILRVWRRLLLPHNWDRRTVAGAIGTLTVLLALVSGWVWSSGGDLLVVGFNLLNWHITLGVILTLVVLLHALLRAKAPRRRDLQNRRQFLQLSGTALGAVAAWRLQRPAATAAGWRGSDRRWTGSYEQGSFQGNAFPATSWVADRPRVLPSETYRLQVAGLVETPLELRIAELQPNETVTATLDCTGGFYSTQHWHGVRLGSLLDLAGVQANAAYVRVISYTGYRWSFALPEARTLLLATSVGDETLSHPHGGPLRLVAPGRRGFQWVKWVVRLELHDSPDPGSVLSTLWSSVTPEGRGEI